MGLAWEWSPPTIVCVCLDFHSQAASDPRRWSREGSSWRSRRRYKFSSSSSSLLEFQLNSLCNPSTFSYKVLYQNGRGIRQIRIRGGYAFPLVNLVAAIAHQTGDDGFVLSMQVLDFFGVDSTKGLSDSQVWVSEPNCLEVETFNLLQSLWKLNV